MQVPSPKHRAELKVFHKAEALALLRGIGFGRRGMDPFFAEPSPAKCLCRPDSALLAGGSQRDGCVRGVALPQWFLLLVAVLGILSGLPET